MPWKESILRSLGLGLGGAGPCRCCPDGQCWLGTSYAELEAPLPALFRSVQRCLAMACPAVHCPVGGAACCTEVPWALNDVCHCPSVPPAEGSPSVFRPHGMRCACDRPCPRAAGRSSRRFQLILGLRTLGAHKGPRVSPAGLRHLSLTSAEGPTHHTARSTSTSPRCHTQIA